MRIGIRASLNTAALVVTGCSLLATAGCESVIVEKSLFSSNPREQEATAEMHRSRFLETRDAADLRWLLRNSIRSGMSRGEVAQILGEEGQRVQNDARFKRNGGHYRENDALWKWGPDNKGKTILLAFREDTLVNFDPEFFDLSDFDEMAVVDETPDAD